jgi:hypothetical protein
MGQQMRLGKRHPTFQFCGIILLMMSTCLSHPLATATKSSLDNLHHETSNQKCKYKNSRAQHKSFYRPYITKHQPKYVNVQYMPLFERGKNEIIP